MADTIVVLSEKDASLLRSLLDRIRRDSPEKAAGLINALTPDSDYLPPEKYLGKTPTGGIPGISGDILGYAECDVYRCLDGGATEATGYTKVVYNSGPAVEGGKFVSIERDKYGIWHVGTAGSSLTVESLTALGNITSGPVTGVAVLDFDPDTGFQLRFDPAAATVVIVGMKAASVDNWGVVTNNLTTPQEFGGDKWFQNQVQFYDKVSAINASGPGTAYHGGYYAIHSVDSGTDVVAWGLEPTVAVGGWGTTNPYNFMVLCSGGSVSSYNGTRVGLRVGYHTDVDTHFGCTLIIDPRVSGGASYPLPSFNINDPGNPALVHNGLWQEVDIGDAAGTKLSFKGGLFVGSYTGAITTTTTNTTTLPATTATATTTPGGATTAGATTTAAVTTTAGGGTTAGATTTASGGTTAAATTTAAPATTVAATTTAAATTTQASTTTTGSGATGPPTITSISPQGVTHGIQSSITINGTNFVGVTGVTGVQFGIYNADSYTVNSSTKITALFTPPNQGGYAVKVSNNLGSSTQSITLNAT